MGKQPYTEARKQANKEWDKRNRDRYARISLVVAAEYKPEILAAASAANQSVNAYINQAIQERIARDSDNN